MCTAIALFQVRDDLPLVLAANRDEVTGRPAAAPAVLATGPRVVGGRDLLRGGTWMGGAEHGMLAVVTNQRPTTAPVARPRSRGELVLGVLARRTVPEALAWLRDQDPALFNGFNLLFGTAEDLRVVHGRPDVARLEALALEPGVHVLSNDRLGSPAFPKCGRAASHVTPHLRRPWADLVEVLRAALSDHETPDLPPEAVPPGIPPAVARAAGAVCVHAPGYGTRSSSIMAAVPGRTTVYLHAPGPPCQVPYADVSALLDAPRHA